MPKPSSNDLIKASLAIFIAYSLFSLANFIYHFLAARMLGPAEYAVVASLFALVYIMAIGSTTIQNTFTKFTARFNGKKEYEKIAYLFIRGTRKLAIFSLIAFVVYLLISPLIASFLKISIVPVLLLSPLILLSVFISLNRGILQGLQKFNALGINLVIEGGLKVILAVLFIYLGFKSGGAIAAVSVGTFIALMFTYPYLLFDKSSKRIIINSKEIYSFTAISLISLLLITMIYSLDVFLVKHFFSAESAGHYAALSLLGKIIFAGATAIGMVMFPKIAELKSNEKQRAIFKKSLIITGLLSCIITLFYFLFPTLIVNAIFGSQYLEIVPLLGFFGIFMSLFSLSYICVLNKLAIGKKKFIWLIAAAVLFEIILISIFHSSLNQIVIILIALNLILFIPLLKQ